MKKFIFILLLMIVLSGCMPTKIEYVNTNSEQELSEQSETSDENLNRDVSEEPTYEEADIISIEPSDKKDDFWDYWKVTNNGDKTLEKVSLQVAYYDADGVMVDDSFFFDDSGILPGKSVLIRSASTENHASQEVIGYYYDYPNVSVGDLYRVQINRLTKECEFMYWSEDLA